jgi:predicted DNA-binding WGR domain protein
MRRFELSEGTSNKFWEIALEGSGFTVRFGRIGTNGQVQEKRFATPEKARAQHDKSIAEKLKKGYAEVGTASTAAAPPEKTERTEAAAPEREDHRTIIATDPSTWPEEMRAELPPTRAWPGPAIALDRRAIWKKMRARAAKVSSPLANVEAAARLSAESPPESRADDEVELAIAAWLGAVGSYDFRWVSNGLELIIDHWVVTAGLDHAVRLHERFDLSISPQHNEHKLIALRRLARHLAHAPESAYAAARESAIARAANRHAIAYLFPESGEADRIVMSGSAGNYGIGGLRPSTPAAITTIEALEHFASYCTPRHLGETPEGACLNFVARFGEAAVDPLRRLMEREANDPRAILAMARAIGLVSTAAAFATLAARAPEEGSLTALREAALRTPELALVPLTNAALGRGPSAHALRALLAQVVRATQAIPEAELPEDARRTIAELRSKLGAQREEASEDEIPAVISSPPWLAKKKRAEAPVLAQIEPLAFVERMVWKPGVREAWRTFEAAPWARERAAAIHGMFGVSAEVMARAETGEPLAILELRKQAQVYYDIAGDVLAACTPGIARAILIALADKRFFAPERGLRKLAAEQEIAILDALLAFAQHHPAEAMPVLLPYESPNVARVAVAALAQKKTRQVARAWLLAHPEAAAIGAIPLAVSDRGKERTAAEDALRVLASEAGEDLVMEVAARYGEPVRAAVRAILDFDPRDLFPAKMPKLPEFISPAALPRPVLRANGKSVPGAAMEAAILALAISRLDAPYEGALDLKRACTSASLAELAWEIFSAWLNAGAPSKEGWAFAQLGILGDDECARRLAPLVRAWPGESAHQRAVTGLDVLAGIGTDVALMHLHGIAQKVKFKALQAHARAKIDSIAQAREMTADELGDRLVPDLGLDEQGSLALDFGPRHFRVSFDETLRPFVRDAEHTRLAELPKPRKDDDVEKAKAATDLWKALKKDARTIARQQILRLESAMCMRRRWSAEVHRRFLVEHPLLRHLAVRLLWASYRGDSIESLFRVAEDGSFADANDDAWELPEDATVGLPHQLELSIEQTQRFSQTFGDYEILQPFKQLGREVYALRADEKSAPAIDRWKDRVVPTGAVLNLESQGWRRGAPQDGGVSFWLEREVPGPNGAILVALDIEPGVIAGMATEWKDQKLLGVGIGREWRWSKQPSAVSFGALHPIVTSEILRDIEGITSGSAA